MDSYSVVSRLGGGHLIDEIAEALAAVAGEVVAIRKKGAVTIKLDVDVMKEGGERAVIVHEVVSKSPPKRDPLGALLYAQDGELHKEDPAQPSFEGFRTVESSDGTVIEVEPHTGVIREA